MGLSLGKILAGLGVAGAGIVASVWLEPDQPINRLAAKLDQASERKRGIHFQLTPAFSCHMGDLDVVRLLATSETPVLISLERVDRSVTPQLERLVARDLYKDLDLSFKLADAADDGVWALNVCLNPTKSRRCFGKNSVNMERLGHAAYIKSQDERHGQIPWRRKPGRDWLVYSQIFTLKRGKLELVNSFSQMEGYKISQRSQRSLGSILRRTTSMPAIVDYFPGRTRVSARLRAYSPLGCTQQARLQARRDLDANWQNSPADLEQLERKTIRQIELLESKRRHKGKTNKRGQGRKRTAPRQRSPGK